MFRITRQFELQIEHPPESQIKRITDEVWSGLDDLARAWRTQAALRISYSRDANTRRAPCYYEMGWVVPGSYGPCTTIAANPSGCTYRRTRASSPLWRMRTRDTRERSSYHRLALRRRLYPTAKSTSPIRRTCPRKTRRATRTDLLRRTSMLRSATFDSTLLHEK